MGVVKSRRRCTVSCRLHLFRSIFAMQPRPLRALMPSVCFLSLDLYPRQRRVSTLTSLLLPGTDSCISLRWMHPWHLGFPGHCLLDSSKQALPLRHLRSGDPRLPVCMWYTCSTRITPNLVQSSAERWWGPPRGSVRRRIRPAAPLH